MRLQLPKPIPRSPTTDNAIHHPYEWGEGALIENYQKTQLGKNGQKRVHNSWINCTNEGKVR